VKKKWKILKTDEEVKIAWDPFRLKIFSTFRMSEEPLTVKQVADRMGEVPAKVHYHVQKLLSIDMLELVRTETIRGIIAKYYTNKYSGSDVHPYSISEDIQVKYVRHAHYENFNRSVANFYDSMVLTDRVMKTKEETQFIDSACVFYKIHLTPKERDEFEKYILEVAKKYAKPGEGKKEYGLLAGLTRRT
jgi:hypothetical protein